MQQIRFPLGLCPRPHWGAYNAPPDSLAVLKGPTSKGMEWEGKGRGREVMGKGRGGKGTRGEGGREEEGGRETKGFISRIFLFEPWQLCL